MPTATSDAATVRTMIARMTPANRPGVGPLRAVSPERDQVDVGGVEHDLDRHQHGDRIAPDQHARQADRERGGGEVEEPGQRNVVLIASALSARSTVSIIEPGMTPDSACGSPATGTMCLPARRRRLQAACTRQPGSRDSSRRDRRPARAAAARPPRDGRSRSRPTRAAVSSRPATSKAIT